jgi:hypothetical protein
MKYKNVRTMFIDGEWQLFNEVKEPLELFLSAFALIDVTQSYDNFPSLGEGKFVNFVGNLACPTNTNMRGALVENYHTIENVPVAHFTPEGIFV